MGISIGDTKAKLWLGDTKVQRAYLGDTLVYSSGNTVTYHVDTGSTYQEEVDEGASCLSPKTFTPTKSGWIFAGWRSDSAANPNCYTSYVMGDSPVTLYAVFFQVVTLSYNGNGASDGSVAAQSGTRYWNSGNVANPTFTLQANGFTRSGYNFTAWALNGGTQYAAGASIALAVSATMYAVWVSNAYYAIQNGVIINAPNATAFSGGYGNGSGTITAVTPNFYGGTGHSNGYGDNSWGCDTGIMSTQGQSTMRVVYEDGTWGSPCIFAYAKVIAYSASGAVTYLEGQAGSYGSVVKGMPGFSDKTAAKTYDVSAYVSVRVIVDSLEKRTNDANCWVEIGLHEVRFY